MASVHRAAPILFVAISLGASLAGCRTETVHLDLSAADDISVSARSLRKPASPVAVLSVAWRPIEDRRLDRKLLGHIGPQAYVAESILPWIDRQLGAIHGPDLIIVNNPAKADVVITPYLLKFYLQSIDVTKSAVVVLALKFEPSGQPAQERIYRGQYAGMNWSDSDEEMIGALRAAFSDCLHHIVTDLETQAQLKAANELSSLTAAGSGTPPTTAPPQK